jgi:hypothetical protein
MRTLGDYRALSELTFGEQSAATKFLDNKISKSPNGKDERVIVEESQMLYLLCSLHQKGVVSKVVES